jgi:hypothetical protein
MLIYIAIILTVSVIIKIGIYIEGIKRRREYIAAINRLCNLISERIDNGKSDYI